MVKPHTTSPGRTESIAALMILSVLACIVVVVYSVHLDFNPAVDLFVGRSSSGQDSAFAEAKGLKPIVKLPDDVGILSANEAFHAHDLSDKINGKAQFYLSAGFDQLNCQRFVSLRDPDLWAEVFVYHMKDAAAAFAVYSGQRRERAEALTLSRHVYLADNAVFLAKGSVYAEIIAPVVTPESRKLLLALAASVIEQVPDTEAGIKEASLFPPERLDPDSIQLLAADVFGFQALNSVYTATYTEGDSTLTAFVSPRSSPQEARTLGHAYSDFLMQFGGRPVTGSRVLQEGLVIEIVDTFEVIFTKGSFLAGVHEAENRAMAEQLANRLIHHLSEVPDGF